MWPCDHAPTLIFKPNFRKAPCGGMSHLLVTGQHSASYPMVEINMNSKQLVTRLMHKSTDVVVLLGAGDKPPLYTEPLDKLNSELGPWSHLRLSDWSSLLTLGALPYTWHIVVPNLMLSKTNRVVTFQSKTHIVIYCSWNCAHLCTHGWVCLQKRSV